MKNLEQQVRAVLAGFGPDLVAEAREGRLSRAHGLDAVVDALWATVHAPSGSRSAVLLGESGSGKTAAVHELAARLAEREPERGWIVLRIASAEFLRGTKYIGEWETRVSELIELVSRPAAVIVYVPDVELLDGIGSTETSTSNVASLLAPYLESGQVCLVGESTRSAFAAGLGRTPALRRPLEPIHVEPADRPGTLRVLEGVAADVGARIERATLERLVEFADLFGVAVEQPGRSVALLRRVADACDGPITPRAVLDTLAATTGLPVDLLDDEQALDLAAVRDFLTRRVMGQTRAVDAVVDLITLFKAGLTHPGRPLAVLLFVGPTGVGKTELARALAEYLFGSPERLLRFDLSEYASYESYERLIGSRASRSEGTLTAAVREQPFSVVLLDEIEKAHANVFDLCLQLFDAGRLTDGSGRAVDFRRTIVILTSNVGSAVRTDTGVGFSGESGPRAPETADVQRELERFFRPEFLNRIGQVVHFAPLDLDTAEQIARRELDAVLARSGIVRRGLEVDVDPALVSLLLERGYSAAFGARPLERTVEQLVLLPLARVIARSPRVGDQVLHLSVRHGEVAVKLVAPPADEGGQPRLIPVPRRRAEPARAPSANLESARDAARALIARVESLERAAEAVRSLRGELVERSGATDFWDDRTEALADLDAMHRCDALTAEVEGAGKRVRAAAEGALRTTRPRDAAAILDRVAQLDRRVRQLEFLVARDPRTALGDALIEITSLRAVEGEAPLAGVARVGRLLRAWALKRGYTVRVLSDRLGGEPFSDAALLAIDGPGAHAMLAGEEGLHQFTTRPADPGRHSRRRERESVRVDVLAADAILAPESIALGCTALASPAGRFDRRPRLAVSLSHRPTRTRVEAWFPGSREEAAEALGAWLAARVARAGANESASESATVVRRYDLEPDPRVRDTRTGASSTQLAAVLDGAIDAFLPPFEPAAARSS